MSRVDEILAKVQTLKSEAGTRESRYDDLEDAYYGKLVDRQREGAWTAANSSALPDRIKAKNVTIVVNFLKQVVEAKRAFIGIIPNLRVPTFDMDPKTVELCEKLERVIWGGIWGPSNIGRRMGDAGFYQSLLGTAVGCIWPDFEIKRPKIVIRSPRGFYCVPEDEDGIVLSEAMFLSEVPGMQAAARFADKKLADQKTVKVVEYWDKETRTIIAGEKIVPGKSFSHGLGFVPILTMPNIGIPGSPFGDSDIESGIELQKEINYRHTLEAEILEQMIIQPMVLEGAENFPEDMTLTPDTILTVAQGGKGYRMPALQVPYQWIQLTQQLEQLMDRVVDAPSALRSEFQGSVLTGKGFSSMMGPMQARMELRHQYVYPALEKLTQMGLQMWEKMWGSEEHIVSGNYNKTRFAEKFRFEEFGDYFEVEVFLDSSAYFDQQSRFVMSLQGIQNRVISKLTAMQYNPMVRDVSREAEQIRKEQTEDVQFAQQAQMIAQSPTTVNPPMGEPGKTAYSLERGYMGETPPAPAQGGLEQIATPAVPSAPTAIPGLEDKGEPGLLDDVVNLFSAIPNIKGRVWLVGAVLDGDVSKGIHVYVSAAVDKQTILNFIAKMVPAIHGKVSFTVGVPQEESVEVTPGKEQLGQAAETTVAPETGLQPEQMGQAGQEA